MGVHRHIAEVVFDANVYRSTVHGDRREVDLERDAVETTSLFALGRGTPRWPLLRRYWLLILTLRSRNSILVVCGGVRRGSCW